MRRKVRVMDNNYLVSIVLPIYNQKVYLDRSIQSLQKQSYSNIEIVLVNDGSTDNSLEIIKKYKGEDERIVVVDKDNGGLVDATIEGIKNASGDYIAFLDPDDYVGEHFIENFISELDNDYDFLAFGFYKDNNGRLTPYLLKQDKVFKNADIIELRKNILLSKDSTEIPNDIFISRWNKLYKKECADKIVKRFVNYKEVSLGEDSIFTYLLLSGSKYGKAIQACNTYFYNVGNQNSMMKSDDIDKHIGKARKTYELFVKLLKEKKDSLDNAYSLYSHLTLSFFNRLQKTNDKSFKDAYKIFRKDTILRQALKTELKRTTNKREKITILLKRHISSPSLYNLFTIRIKNGLGNINSIARDWISTIKDMRSGIAKSLRLHKFKNNRRIAFKDIYKKMPLIEQRIQPFLDEYKDKTTDFDKCPINKNIFVFWWDGFENSPKVVKRCLDSVKRNNPESKTIEITKDTYKEYTDINPIIIGDYEKGKISVQTFSDILRFNLLKNNGGTWIDATIFFTQKYDLSEGLKNKPLESVEFSTSKDYLKYKNNTCSWSGYFISSRENSVFVNAVDYIFEQYYLKYKTYTTYFFIDAVLMICKINKLDNGALDNIQYNPSDMFVLRQIINNKYSGYYHDVIDKIPQKLQWNIKIIKEKNSNYHKILMG